MTPPSPSPARPPAARLAVPPALAWLRDDAALRPPTIARVAGLTPDALARWAAGSWRPTRAEVPLVPALLRLDAHVRARFPDDRERRAWWTVGRRALGWLSPAELLRRGKIGEVLLLAATPDDAQDDAGGGRL